MKNIKKIALILAAILLFQPLTFAVDTQLNKEIIALELELTKMKTRSGEYSELSEGALNRKIARTEKKLAKKKKAAKKEAEKDAERIKKGAKEAAELKPHKKYGVLVQGERRVLYNLAQCCKPEYPDLIAGYVTRSKGVSIHRADCLIYQRIPQKEDRSVEVSWDVKE